MIAYVDSSVLLRLILRKPNPIEDLQSYETLVSSSELLAVATRACGIEVVGAQIMGPTPSV